MILSPKNLFMRYRENGKLEIYYDHNECFGDAGLALNKRGRFA